MEAWSHSIDELLHELEALYLADHVLFLVVIIRAFRLRLFWLLPIGLLLTLQISPHWYPTDDGFEYLSTAKAFSEGRIGEVFQKYDLFACQGYAAAISPAFVLGDRPFLALSMIQWAFGILSLVGVYQWSRRHFSDRRIQFIIVGLTLLNAVFLFYYRRTLKEIVFFACAVWTVNLCHELLENRRTGIRLVVTAALAGLMGAASVSVRYTGIVIPFIFGVNVVWAIVRREQSLRQAILPVSIAAGLPLAMLFSCLNYDQRVVAANRGDTYGNTFQQAATERPHQLFEGIRRNIEVVGRIIVPGFSKAYGKPYDWKSTNTLIGILCVIPVSLGWWRLVRKRRDLFVQLLPAYVALYSIWPFDQGTRFLTVMLPVLMASAWKGLSPLYRRPVLVGRLYLAAHLGVALVYWIGVDRPRAQETASHWQIVDQLANEIGEHSKNGAAADDDLKTRRMLQLALDENIFEYEDNTELPERIRWFLSPQNEPPPQGFVSQLKVGNLVYYVLETELARRDGSKIVEDVSKTETADVLATSDMKSSRLEVANGKSQRGKTKQ